MKFVKPLNDTKGMGCIKVSLAMLPILLMSVFSYGLRPALLALISVLVSNLLDRLVFRMRGMKYDRTDWSSGVTGLVVVMLMPACVPLWLVIFADIIAIMMAKGAFGGYGNNIFNPACVALAMSSMMFTDRMFDYPAPFVHIPIFGEPDQSLLSSTLSTLHMGGVPYLSVPDVLEGNIVGPIACCGFAVLLACGLFLLVTKTISFQISASFLAAVGLFTFFFPRINSTRINSMLFELLCTPILFCAFFVVTDPVTSPKRAMSQIIYGALTGVLSMLFSYYGAYEFGVPFAVLLMNALTTYIDRRVAVLEGKYSIGRQIGGES